MNYPMELHIEPTLEQVGNAINALGNYARTCGFNDKVTFQTSLCVAEALNNIIEHTQHEKHLSDEKITLSCQLLKSIMLIKIVHKAPAYKINKGKLENLLATSGRGWIIMERWLDKISYQHSNGFNILLMAKLPTVR